MVRTRLFIGALAAATGIALAGCSGDDHSDAPKPAESSTESYAPADPDEQELGDVDGIPDETPQEDPTPRDQAGALKIAADALRAYYDTKGSADDWIKRLEPYLTHTAQEAYATTDPRNIHPQKVTGDGQVVRFDGGGKIVVAVPTDAGDVQVDVLIEEDGGPWKVDRFHFPTTGGTQ